MRYLSWVQGAAYSSELLPWYLFWQEEKTCFSSCCTWLSREHFWKWSVLCSEKARSNICINPNTTFKCEEIELSFLFFQTEPLSQKLQTPGWEGDGSAARTSFLPDCFLWMLYVMENVAGVLSSATCCALALPELNSDDAVSHIMGQGRSSVGVWAELDGQRREGSHLVYYCWLESHEL